MSELSWNAIRRAVYDRAKGCCEYCRTCDDNTGQIMEVEHIDPDNGDDLENLCLSCGNCNRSKAIATFAIDPDANEPVSLFNPRKQRWLDHFNWLENGAIIQGITPTGRATVNRLKMNRLHIVTARRRWITAKFHPPPE